MSEIAQGQEWKLMDGTTFEVDSYDPESECAIGTHEGDSFLSFNAPFQRADLLGLGTLVTAN